MQRIRGFGNDARYKPGLQGEQALADISRSVLYCHSNETRAPIANPPNIVHN